MTLAALGAVVLGSGIVGVILLIVLIILLLRLL